MKYISSVFIIFVTGCASGQGMPMTKYHQQQATPQSFELCHGYSCTFHTPVGITEKDWQDVLRIFNSASSNAEIERQKITKSIAKIEKIVTETYDLIPDAAKAKTLRNGNYQMDCIDETINTDRYLRFLSDEDVFQFHKVIDPIHRGYFIDGMWPHNSAAIEEIKTGTVYAIDSYFHDNGVKVDAVPKAIWLDNWSPNEAKND